ncbi:hypothetical protein ACWCXB_24175 [Streptomyces sp. NPDC001514]
MKHGDGLGVDVEIVERDPGHRGFLPQPKRWRVEQTYGILVLHRRLVRDYEHRPSSSASRVYWAMSHVMIRRLTGANIPHLARRDGEHMNIRPLLEALDLQEDAARVLANDLRTQIDDLQTQLREAETRLEHLAITRKTVTGLADRLPTSPPELPEHRDYTRIPADFNETTGPSAGEGHLPGSRPRSAAEERRRHPGQAETPGQTRHPHRSRHRQLRQEAVVGTAASNPAPSLSPNNPRTPKSPVLRLGFSNAW